MNLLKTWPGRLTVCLVVIGVSSVAFQFVIEAPINLPDSFLALPVMFLWQPILGLPFVIFSAWWIKDQRLHLLVLITPFVLAAYCARLILGSPPSMTEEERKELKELIGEEFIERDNQNRPGYKRKIFPPY